MIEQHIWNYDFECESNVIDVYVRRPRRKINEPSRPNCYRPFVASAIV
jgi:DNA-binding response OmpR family regulator